MLETKLKIFKDILGNPQVSSKSEYLFFCPEHDHHKKKLSVNFQKNVAKCWFCGIRFGSLKQVVKKYGTFADLQEWKELNRTTDFSEQSLFFGTKEEVIKEKVVLPKEYVCLAQQTLSGNARQALEYLKERGITKKDVYSWKIGYCDSGEYAERVIFPSFSLKGRLDYFVGRTYNKKVTFEKYKNPTHDANVIFNELLIDWRRPLILTEGVFDAIKCDNSVPLLGSSISEDSALFRKILEASDDIIIALDDDAQDKQNDMANLFHSYDIKTYIVTGLKKDFGEMTKQEVKQKIEEAEEYSFQSMIKQKLRRL